MQKPVQQSEDLVTVDLGLAGGTMLRVPSRLPDIMVMVYGEVLSNLSVTLLL